MKRVRLSIIIPCYNEQKNIPLLLDRARSVLPCDDVELILVNNGSTDDSARVLNDLVPRHPFARKLDLELNRGYGGGILEGLRAARGEYIGWTHADMQTDVLDAVRALDIIESKGGPPNIYVKGKRTGRVWSESVFTAGMSLIETIYLRTLLQDINAQPNIFHRSFFAAWKNPPGDFSLDLYALYQARRMRLDIVRFEVKFPKRIHGASSWNSGFSAKWRFVRRTLASSIAMKKSSR